MQFIPGLLNEIEAAKLLSGAVPLDAGRKGNDWIIALPEAAPDPAVSVIALELDGPPRVEPYTIRPDVQGRLALVLKEPPELSRTLRDSPTSTLVLATAVLSYTDRRG